MSMIRTWRWDSSWHGSYAAVWWVIHSFQFCFILLNLVCSHQCSRPTVYVLGTKRDAKKCRAGTFPCWGQLPSRSALSFFPPCTVPWKPGLDGPQHRDPGPLALHCLAGEVWQEMGGQEGAVGYLLPTSLLSCRLLSVVASVQVPFCIQPFPRADPDVPSSSPLCPSSKCPPTVFLSSDAAPPLLFP